MISRKPLSISLCAVLLAIFAVSAFAGHGEDPRWESKTLPGEKDEKHVDVDLRAGGEGRSALDTERERRMLSILKQPPIPLKTPDKVLRVLLLPFVDSEDVLHNYKYSFIKVDEGKWVIGDYLMEPAKAGRRIFTPLEGVVPRGETDRKPEDGPEKSAPQTETR